MKNCKGKCKNIHDRHSTPVSSHWQPEDYNFWKSIETSHGRSHPSYRSIPPSSSSSFSSTPSSLKRNTTTGPYQYLSDSIRNSAHSNSTALCLSQFRWCVACYESKLLTIEPILFIIMFAVYLQKIVFELYTFHTFAWLSIRDGNTSFSRSNMSECVSTTSLSNVSYMERVYDIDHLLWSNRTGDVVESETGILIMMTNITLGVLSIFGTLMVGPLANRFGRKPALVSILGGMLLQATLMVLIIELDLDVHFFILGSGLRGIMGGVAGVYTVSYSYITEYGMNRKKWLVLRIGIVEVLSFVAVSLGLLLGGVGIEVLRCDFDPLAYIVLGSILVAFLYASIAMTDSRRHVFATSTSDSPLPQKEHKVSISPVALWRGVRLFLSKDSPRFKLWLSLLVMIVSVMNSSGMTAVITLFLLHQPLVWSPMYIGGFLGMSEFIHGVVLVVVLPLLLSAGVHDGAIVSMSILLTIAMNVTLAFVEAPWQVFLVGIVQSVEVLIVPTLKAMLSKAVSPEERGPLLSFLSIAQVLSMIVGSAVYIPLYILSLNYALPRHHSSGAVFLLMAFVYVATIPLMCGLSIGNWVEKRRNNIATSSVFDSEWSSSVAAPLLREEQASIQRPKPHPFEVSIGQDVVDKEASLQSQQNQEERNRELLEHSYCSLSDYHSNKQ